MAVSALSVPSCRHHEKSCHFTPPCSGGTRRSTASTMALASTSITTPGLFLKRPRERLLRIVQQQTQRRVPEWGDLLLDQGLRVLAERWRVHYNTVRPHSSLGYKPPAPEAWPTNSKGNGEVETAARFPLLTPDGRYLNSEVNALH
jgi:hypothetical protein